MSNESRAKFEEWVLKCFGDAFHDFSQWGENSGNVNPNVVNYANHEVARLWMGWQSRQSEIDSLRAENERLSDELLNLSKWKEINGFRGDSWQGQLSEALNDVARELRNVAKGQSNE